MEAKTASSRRISLSASEHRKLRCVLNDTYGEPSRRARARVLLLAAQGKEDLEIAEGLRLPIETVVQTRERFARCRLGALERPPVRLLPLPEPPRKAPRAVRITLRGSERRKLQRIVRAHRSPQREVLRARIVLAAAEGDGNHEVARKLGCDIQTVQKWRSRFAQDRLEGLHDLPREGRPPKFEATQKHDAIALILGEPPAPHARWTLELAVDAIIGRGIAPSISRETLSHWLRTADIKPHRNRYWLTSKDPDFKSKMDAVVELYLYLPTDGRVLCLDEKTCIPAREQLHAALPTRPGRVRRVEFEYERHGTAHLLASFEVHNGQVLAECVERNDSDAFIRFLKRLMEHYPQDEKLYLVLDNGTTHRSKQTQQLFEEHKERLVPVFLPTHASWLNQIELWFSALTRQALRHVSFRSRQELVERIYAYVEEHNRTARPYRWTRSGQPLRAD